MKHICFNYTLCGSIGNVDVYKTRFGYILADQNDNSKFKSIRIDKE